MWQAPIEEEGEQVAQRDQVVPSALLDFFVRIFRREQEISNEWNLTSVWNVQAILIEVALGNSEVD